MTQSLPHAFKCAAEGVAFAFKQRNMRIDSGFAVAAVVLGFALRIDLVSPEYHVLAKHAKDCAAGAALILAAASVVVAAIVFIPKIGEVLC